MSKEQANYGSTRAENMHSDSTDISTGRGGPDINMYQQKKTLAEGMLGLALISANASQLRYVLEMPRHSYFDIMVGLLLASILLQVAVGIGLVWNARYDVNDRKEVLSADKANNRTVIVIFFITVINVFLMAFNTVNSSGTSGRGN